MCPRPRCSIARASSPRASASSAHAISRSNAARSSGDIARMTPRRSRGAAAEVKHEAAAAAIRERRESTRIVRLSSWHRRDRADGYRLRQIAARLVALLWVRERGLRRVGIEERIHEAIGEHASRVDAGAIANREEALHVLAVGLAQRARDPRDVLPLLGPMRSGARELHPLA